MALGCDSLVLVLCVLFIGLRSKCLDSITSNYSVFPM